MADITLGTGSASSTPSTNNVVIYAKTADKKLYYKNDAGLESPPLGGPILGTATATTSGTSITFSGIPSWVTKITISLAAVSTNGTSVILLRAGNTTVETSGYTSTAGGLITASSGVNSQTTGWGLKNDNSAASAYSGNITMALLNPSTNLWTVSGIFGTDTATLAFMAGSKAFLGVIDRIALTTTSGTDAFDGGSMNIMYE